MSNHVKVSALLMCAGKSSRMGENHKLLLEIGNQSVLRRVASEIVSAHFFEVIAVTGFANSEIEKELAGLSLKIVHNQNFDRGLHSSIREGVLRLDPEADFFAVCLGDQPMLNFHHYNKLIEAAQTVSEETKLIYPTVNGKRGNPTLISTSLIMEILEHTDDDKGCAYLFERYPDESYGVELKDESTLIDIDTPQIFEQVKFHMEKRP